MRNLKEDVLHKLRILNENDRDLRTIVIGCNPNYIRGPDYKITSKVLKILEKLEKKEKVYRKKKFLNLAYNNKGNEFEIYYLS